MNLDKYKNDGWGLSRLGLQKLFEILNNFSNEVRIVEFGSGKSTEFFDDYIKLFNKKIKVDSFDNDIRYAYNPSPNSNIKVKMRNLIECSDDSFHEMFNNKKINDSKLYHKTSELTTKQKNNFYQIDDGDINSKYDLVVLDGPNGNGRSLAFLHLINHLNDGAYVFIDDYTHYDFVLRFKSIFNCETYFEHKRGMIDQWNLGGDFIILKVNNL